MKQYRVRIVLEEAEEVAGEYTQCGHLNYSTAASNDKEAALACYKALTNVGFYWRFP